MRIGVSLFTVIVLWNCKPADRSKEGIHGWQRDTASFERAYVDSLRQKIESGAYMDINSVVVIREGRLLIEEYFNGGGRDLPHDVRSVGKTFAAAILGVALADGYLKSTDQSLDEFYTLTSYPNFSEQKRHITLSHLMTMSSGFNGNDNDPGSPGNEENMYPRENWVEWALGLPMSSHRKPGDSSVYFTAGVVILGDILHQSVPGGLEEYANEKIFQPLEINNYEWLYTPQHVVSTAGGIRLTSLDLAKFGQLYLAKGRWNGQEIIPSAWIDESMTRYYETRFDNNGYGYLMWTKSYQVAGGNYQTFYCSGNGGNKIFVFRELDAVVVVTASAYNRRYAHPQVDDLMMRYILPAILSVKQR